MEKMTAEKALEMFGSGFDCAAVTLSSAADKVGIDDKEAKRAAAAFGGGMWRGDTCGCVVGALIALGLRYGNDEPADDASKQELLSHKQSFEQRFCEVHGSVTCRQILGYDLSIPEEMATLQEKGLLQTLCPQVAADACAILDGEL